MAFEVLDLPDRNTHAYWCPVCRRLFCRPMPWHALGAHQAYSPDDPRPKDHPSCTGIARLVDRPDVLTAYRLGGHRAVDALAEDRIRWSPTE